MSEASITCQTEVMFYDTDCGAVVHNMAYLRFIEFARTKLAAKLGMDLATMSGKNEFPVVARTEIDYLKPARLGDILDVTSRLSGVDRVRFYIDTDIHRVSDGRKIVACRQTLALVRMPEGKVLPAPQEWKPLMKTDVGSPA